MMGKSQVMLLLLVCMIGFGCTSAHPNKAKSSLLLTPDSPEMNQRAPDVFKVRMETGRGEMLIEVHRDWAPRGADHFYNLVRAGYYDGAKVFRIRKGLWAQFGINGDPKISNVWRNRNILDDPPHESNKRGTIAYAFAVPNGRTTQMFINLADNAATHDPEPFVPFGKVIKGMEVADAWYADYGENAGSGIRAGKQGPLFEIGNEYLEKNFPRLDYIVSAKIINQLIKSHSSFSQDR
jgi:cyclophilin family peptidyl-prolyl cis-trans isomerase